MNTLNKTVEPVAHLVNELHRHLASDPKAAEHILKGVWKLIRHLVLGCDNCAQAPLRQQDPSKG